MNIMWFSAGVSSAVALVLAKEKIDKVLYQHIEDQHPDTMRFLHDVEVFCGKQIEIMRSKYTCVEAVARAFGYVNGVRGAKCTEILKKRVRKEWEIDNPGRHTYFWGMDVEESKRAESLRKSMSEYDHQFPLISNGFSKRDAHVYLDQIGIKRPMMYDMGYHNNNCVGCVKGGKGYWNKIRKDFPEVFASRSAMERLIGHSCLNGIFLDELDPKAGRHDEPISMECGIFCIPGMYDEKGGYRMIPGGWQNSLERRPE